MGIDVATTSGFALIDSLDKEEDRCTLWVAPSGVPRIKTLHLLARTVTHLLTLWHPGVVVIEGYALGPNPHTNTKLVEFGTVVRMSVADSGIAWYEIGPPSLKKWTTGNGRADKVMMAEHASKRWDFQGKQHDIVDAYALAQIGQLPLDQLLSVPSVMIGGL